MRTILLLMLSGMFLGNLQAQQLDPTVISPYGGTTTIQGLSIDWTLGELAVGHFRSSESFFTEGFHQPLLKVSELDRGPDDHDSMLQVEIRPNPVVSKLDLAFGQPLEESTSVLLMDVQGKIVLNTEIHPGEASYYFDLSSLEAGTFILQVLQQTVGKHKAFQVIKIR